MLNSNSVHRVYTLLLSRIMRQFLRGDMLRQGKINLAKYSNCKFKRYGYGRYDLRKVLIECTHTEINCSN